MAMARQSGAGCCYMLNEIQVEAATVTITIIALNKNITNCENNQFELNIFSFDFFIK